MPQMLMITQKYVIFYVYISLQVWTVFFCRKIKSSVFFLLYSASINLFFLTQIKIRFLIGLQ